VYIANISLNSKPNLKSLQIGSKGLGRSPFLKKTGGKSSWIAPLTEVLSIVLYLHRYRPLNDFPE
jgi:hypothetical protein